MAPNVDDAATIGHQVVTKCNAAMSSGRLVPPTRADLVHTPDYSQLPPDFRELWAELGQMRDEDFRDRPAIKFRELLLPLLLVIVIAMLLVSRLVRMNFMTATIVFYGAIGVLSGLAAWRLWVALMR